MLPPPFLILLLLSVTPADVHAGGEPEPCRSIDGVADLLVQGRVVLLGEIHGTEEIPAFAGDLACHALAAGLPVQVGLELPQADQSRVDSFLRSDGEPADREILYSAFWRQSYQDGRASGAMSDLVERLRRLQDGGSVGITYLDRPAAGRGRDEVMASRLASAIRAAPKSFFVVLAGNVHTRIASGSRWDPDYEPMGHLLTQKLPGADVVSLNAAHKGGTAWVCLAGEPCQSQQLGGRGTLDAPAVILFDGPRGGYHGRFEVGTIQASLPAAAGR